jgi:hypothetical protein
MVTSRRPGLVPRIIIRTYTSILWPKDCGQDSNAIDVELPQLEVLEPPHGIDSIV